MIFIQALELKCPKEDFKMPKIVFKTQKLAFKCLHWCLTFMTWTPVPKSGCGTFKSNCEISTPDGKSQREKLKKLVQAKYVCLGHVHF